MASLTLTGLLLGLTALSTSTPVVRRQDETVPTTTSAPGLQSSIATPIIDGVVQPSGVTDVGKWCKSENVDDPEEAVQIWEDYGVGLYLDTWVQMMPNGGDGWLTNLTEEALAVAEVGEIGTGDCGEIGSTCVPIPSTECSTLVGEYGMPNVYWILQAVQGFHSKLNSAHEYLQDTTIENILSLSEIADDFSEPEEDQTLVTIAGLISSCLFVVGGVAGMASVGASFAGAAASAAVGVAQSELEQARKGHGPEGYEDEAKRKLDAANAQADSSAKFGRGSGAMGGSTYLLGSTFSTISAANALEGQVSRTDLEKALSDLFTNAREGLKRLGRLALGRDAGADYSALPHQEGAGGIIGNDAYVAGFFSDGKFLLADSHPSWDAQLAATFGQYKAKIVEQAIQSLGYQIFSPTWIESGEECGSDQWAGYGSQFVDMGDGNSYCMMLYKPTIDGRCNAVTDCDWEVAPAETINLMQDKYGFNMAEWYKAAYHCAKDGNGTPDPASLPTDLSAPLCFWNTPAKRLTLGTSCGSARCETFTKDFEFSDFE